MRIIAEHAIREEQRSGRLAMWVMSDNGPVEMDHHGSHLIDRHALTTGCITPSEKRPFGLKDRPLWILLPDWRAFKQRFISSREGVVWSEPTRQVRHNRLLDAPQPFTETERLQWIREQTRMKADDAFKAYRKHPRFDGTKQAAFRADWRKERGTTRGRPRKSSL